MDHKIFRRAVRVLSQRFTVYCPDSRDHGKSEKVKTLHYEDMAEDMHAFITALDLHKPVYYGFSDGGIIGLLLASRYPELLSALIVSGASLRPDSTKDLPLRFFRLWSHVGRSDKMRIMLREPDITDEILRAIGDETDEYKACCLNVQHSCEMIERSLDIQKDEECYGLQVCGAMYHLETGEVTFL
jgi:pimeloyl-ACP methyl ester carboxylesterase